MIRDKNLHDLCERLRKETTSFISSVADYCEKTNYMTDEDVKEELKKTVKNYREIKEFMKNSKDKCGDLTISEKKAFRILTEAGY
jgi:hypothetical protein